MLRIPLVAIEGGQIHFFTYKHQGKNINFFIRRSTSGAIHSAFDACYTCYKYYEGFRQDGTYIACSKCGTKFSVADDNWRVGGCTPIGLPHRIDSGAIVIAEGDLQSRGGLF